MRRQQKKLKPAGVLAAVIVSIVGVVAFIVAATVGSRAYVTHHVRASAKAARIAAGPRANVALLGGKLVFSDVAAQSREFIRYYSSIQLTPQQEAIKYEVLAAMPAACCKNSNAYTCCCKCNLSKTVWGLSNHVLSHYAATADELRQVIQAWRDYTNPSGHTGDSCYVGRCNEAPHQDGCGGMLESELII